MTLRGGNGKVGLGTGDPKRDQILAYEDIAFRIRRLIPQVLKAKEQSKKKIVGIFARSKLKDIDKTTEDLYTSAKMYDIPKEEIDELWGQKILLMNGSGKEHIPFIRDTKTGELIYSEVD